jgi:hypothetical protein
MPYSFVRRALERPEAVILFGEHAGNTIDAVWEEGLLGARSLAGGVHREADRGCDAAQVPRALREEAVARTQGFCLICFCRRT